MAPQEALVLPFKAGDKVVAIEHSNGAAWRRFGAKPQTVARCFWGSDGVARLDIEGSLPGAYYANSFRHHRSSGSSVNTDQLHRDLAASTRQVLDDLGRRLDSTLRELARAQGRVQELEQRTRDLRAAIDLLQGLSAELSSTAGEPTDG